MWGKKGRVTQQKFFVAKYAKNGFLRKMLAVSYLGYYCLETEKYRREIKNYLTTLLFF